MTDQAVSGSLDELRLSQIPNRLGLWVSVGIFAIFCWLFFAFTADDAFIVARYGRNLVEHGLLQFNPGEPINALTSPLHGLIMAGLYSLTSEPVSLYKILASLFCCLSVLHLVRALPEDYRGLGAVVMLTSPFAAFWSVGGLETPILLGLVALFCAALLRDGASAGPGLLILAALMFLTRFDSALFTAPAALAVMWTHRSSGRYWLALAGAIVIAFGWLVFAQLTYGSIFPTSYFLKAGNYANASNIFHAIYVVNFLALSVGIWIGAQFFIGKNRIFDTHLISYGFCLLTPYILTMASVHMMFSYRSLIPYLPALVLVLLGRNGLSRKWSVGITSMTIAANLVLGWIILTTTINPAILPLSSAEPKSKNGFSRSLSFEYARVDVSQYRGFTDILKLQAGALQNHWQKSGEASLLTTAGGVSPWYLPEVHVLELLVTYRPHCDFAVRGSVGSLWRSADYIQLYQDSAGFSYPPMTADDLAEVELLPVVHEAQLPFDMHTYTPSSSKLARIALFHNPTPEPRPASVSKRYFEACRLD